MRLRKINYKTTFELSVNSRTRDHGYKLIKSRSRLDIRKTLVRVVYAWNSLPSEVVEAEPAESVNASKNRFDRHKQVV